MRCLADFSEVVEKNILIKTNNFIGGFFVSNLFICLLVLLGLSIILPFVVFYSGKKNKKRFKKSLLINIISFFGILIFSSIVIFNKGVLAAPETQSVDSFTRGMGFFAAALVTGLSTIGAGIATGSAASSALGAISENESIMGKALIFVSLAEGIAIYGLLISFTILGRI